MCKLVVLVRLLLCFDSFILFIRKIGVKWFFVWLKKLLKFWFVWLILIVYVKVYWKGLFMVGIDNICVG